MAEWNGGGGGLGFHDADHINQVCSLTDMEAGRSQDKLIFAFLKKQSKKFKVLYRSAILPPFLLAL